MFTKLVLHGGGANVLWGYRPAVVLTSWRIAKVKQQWTLSGKVARIDAFQARQSPLIFAAPRKGGFWMWPILTLQIGPPGEITATLGPPEQ